MSKTLISEVNFDNIFDNIKIENDTRLSGEDFEAMEHLQNDYNKILQYVTDEEKRIEDMEELPSLSSVGASFSKNGLLSTLYSKLCYIGDYFVSNTISYFSDKYSINLKNNFEKSKRDREMSNYQIERNSHKEIVNFYKTINYNTLLDDIFTQLGGYTFKERYDQEIKDKVKNLIRNYNDERPTVKLQGAKIKDTSFFREDERWGFDISYTYRDDFRALFAGLQHFDSNSNIKPELDEVLDLIASSNIKCINTHALNGEKVIAIRLYKNGSIDIQFKDSLTAIEFSKNYCTMQNIA